SACLSGDAGSRRWPGLTLGDRHGGVGPPCGADLLQRPLYPLQRRIDGSIWGGATLGDVQQLAGDPDLHAYYFLTFLLHKNNTCFKNGCMRRFEFYESLRHPAHKMWRQSVLAFHV